MSLPTGDFSTDKRFTLYPSHNEDGSEYWCAACIFDGELITHNSQEVAANLMTKHVIGCSHNPARVLSDIDEWKIKKGLFADPLEEK